MALPKYAAAPNPNGTWQVVETATGEPILLDDVPQTDLSLEVAEDVAEVLNQMTDDTDG